MTAVSFSTGNSGAEGSAGQRRDAICQIEPKRLERHFFPKVIGARRGAGVIRARESILRWCRVSALEQLTLSFSSHIKIKRPGGGYFFFFICFRQQELLYDFLESLFLL